jgi:general secretion pathway protein B
MSYILDALKKAEQERKRGKAPDLMDNHGYAPQGPRKRLWLYALLVVFVIVAGGLGWYLGHDEPSTDALPFQSSRTQAVPDIHAPQPQPQPQQATQAATPSTELPTAAKQKPIAEDAGRVTETVQTVKPSQPQRITKERLPAAQAEQSGPAPEKKPDPNKVYTISELPDSASKGLPAFAISTHIYSAEPTERLASINGNIGHEGQEIIPGIVLVSVLPDGVLLKHQGYRFKVRLR